MKKPKEKYVLEQTLISDNGIDKVFKPVLSQEEYDRRKKYLEEAGFYLMMEKEKVHSRNEYN